MKSTGIASQCPFFAFTGGDLKQAWVTPCKSKKTLSCAQGLFISDAERAGFEPANRFWRLHALQACALDHSAISPFINGAEISKKIFLLMIRGRPKIF
jgi:hypothetical protein